MFRVLALLSIVSVVITVFCLVEAASTKESRMRNLPKVAWILVIAIFPLAGAVCWLLAGRPRAAVAPDAPTELGDSHRPASGVPRDSDSGEDFLKRVRDRAQEQRRRYEAEKQMDQYTDPDRSADDA